MKPVFRGFHPRENFLLLPLALREGRTVLGDFCPSWQIFLRRPRLNVNSSIAIYIVLPYKQLPCQSHISR
jgi:hypothetical protein